MIRFAFAVAALAAASSAFAGDGFNGLQLVPRFDRDDALVVEVSNWTKLTVTLDQVFMTGDGDDIQIGAPLVKGATISATVRGHGRHDKVMIVKFRRRKHHRKQMGHRQHYTEIEITGIAG